MENMTEYSPGLYPADVWETTPKVKFTPKISDFIFALFTFALGYLFSRWVFFSWQGWGVTVFTSAYLWMATIYMIQKGVFKSNLASWFWFALTWCTGASFALWENAGFIELRALFLFCAAVYYVIIATDNAIMKKTGNYLLLDGLNAVLLVPFGNLLNQYISFSALRKRERKRGGTWPIILGILLAIFLFIILIPQLVRADSGGFSNILKFLSDIFMIDNAVIAEFLFYFVISIPIAAYIFGLVSGAVFKRRTEIIKPDKAEKAVADLRILPPVTVFIILGAVCGLYLVFILSQTPYFFSAFTGRRPDGWLIYSEYARQGFFELCGIAALNLSIITVGNIFCRKRRLESRLLKAFNTALAVITLVLIATAFSKMALYIDVYGLTMPRLLPCAFMVFLAAVFVALIVLQTRNFSIVRFALVLGCVMMCALCLSNPDALVVRYNTDRYISGTLPEYDIDILYRAGAAGVKSAIEVYKTTPDMKLRDSIMEYLRQQYDRMAFDPGRRGDGEFTQTLESYRASDVIKNLRP